MMRPIVSIVVLLHVLYQPPSPAPDQRAKPSTRQVTTTPADSLSSKNLSHTPAAQSILQDQGQPTVPRHGHSGRMLRPYTTNVVVTGGPAAVAPNITSCDMFQSARLHVSTSSASRRPASGSAKRAVLPLETSGTTSLDPVAWTWRNAPPTRPDSSCRGFDMAPASTSHTDLQHSTPARPVTVGFTDGADLLYSHPRVSIQDAQHANLAASPQAQFWAESHRIISNIKQRQETKMAGQAMRPMAASRHHVATLKGCHLDGASATPASSAPPSLILNGSAASWQTLSQGSTPPSGQHQVQDGVEMPAVTSSMARAAQAIVIPAAEHQTAQEESWSATQGPVMSNDTLRTPAVCPSNWEMAATRLASVADLAQPKQWAALDGPDIAPFSSFTRAAAAGQLGLLGRASGTAAARPHGHHTSAPAAEAAPASDDARDSKCRSLQPPPPCNGFLQWLQDEASRVSDPLWQETKMAIKAMPHTISSMHHAVILRSRHLDGTSAKPAASAPPRPGVNGSALICQWQPRHRGSTSPLTPAIILKASQANIIPAAAYTNSWSAAHLPITGNSRTADTISTPNGVSLAFMAQPVVRRLPAPFCTTHLHQQLRRRPPVIMRGSVSTAASSHLQRAWSACGGLPQWLQDATSRLSETLWRTHMGAEEVTAPLPAHVYETSVFANANVTTLSPSHIGRPARHGHKSRRECRSSAHSHGTAPWVPQSLCKIAIQACAAAMRLPAALRAAAHWTCQAACNLLDIAWWALAFLDWCLAPALAALCSSWPRIAGFFRAARALISQRMRQAAAAAPDSSGSADAQESACNITAEDTGRMHAQHVVEVAAAQQDDESHLRPDPPPAIPARDTSSDDPVLPSDPQPQADAALDPAAGQPPSSEPAAAMEDPSLPAATQPCAAQAPAAGQAPSSEPAAAMEDPSLPAATQPCASQAPAADAVAEGMRSAAPGCTESVPPSTEAASAAADSATQLPLSTSASLADDEPSLRIVHDSPFYFCSPRGCFVAFPPGQVGTSAVPLPRARAQRAERPVSMHARALPTVSPSPRRPTGSGTVNVTFSVKGQLAQKATESRARMEESARRCISHLDTAKRAVKGKMPAVDFSRDRVDKWVHSAKRALKSSMPAAAGFSRTTVTNWMQKASKAEPMPPSMSEDAQRTAHISALFQMASSAGMKANDTGHFTACTRMQ